MADAINQDDIDSLFASMGGGAGASPAPEPAPAPEPPPVDDSPASQDDIDALFASMNTPASTPTPAPAPEPPAIDDSPASQNDIDALFASMNAPAAAEAAPVAPPPAPPADDDAPASQDDIDALFASMNNPAPAAAQPVPAPEPPPAQPSAPPAAPPVSTPASQDDINALFASAGVASAAPQAPPPAPAPTALPDGLGDGATSQNDIDALFSQVAGGDVAPEQLTAESADADKAKSDGGTFTPDMQAAVDAMPGGPMSVSDIDAMFAQMNGPAKAPETVPAAKTESVPAPTPEPPPAPEPEPTPVAATVPVAPPPPPPVPETPPPPVAVATAKIPMPAPPAPAAPVSVSIAPPPPASPTVQPPPLSDKEAAATRESLSLMSGGGEVEGLTGQIASLLGALSERARRYQSGWLIADQETRELRNRLATEEHRRALLESEAVAAREEADLLRRQVGKVEGVRLAAEEASRTEIQSRDTRLREAESRLAQVGAEADALREELTRTRREATGSDIENRRARFEADRLRGEVESERMERLRIQRALENREKELQAFQAQQSGQATTLFLDELHRLVRRLEAELDVRTAAAHEALSVLDRMPLPEEAVASGANLRAALMAAAGHASETGDALKSLSREAARPRGNAAVEPVAGRLDLNAFETAIAGYDLARAAEVAGELLRQSLATPAVLMKKIYHCGALRRAEIADHLPALARLLEGIRTVQESQDRALGRESPESEGVYVRMFDFLHNLVRLKMVTRSTGEMWRLFLDLRGRFSFASSDKEWARYRDERLGGE